MAYPHTPKIGFPINSYKVNSYKFREECNYKGVYWGIHLGEDIKRPAGTEIRSIGRGKVVYSALHPKSETRANWGNIIIIAHKNPHSKTPFFSLYAHLGKRLTEKGEIVQQGNAIGFIGKANSTENGWWDEEHLHFGIYTGPWQNKVLPGYWKKGSKRTKLSYWKEPKAFIQNY